MIYNTKLRDLKLYLKLTPLVLIFKNLAQIFRILDSLIFREPSESPLCFFPKINVSSCIKSLLKVVFMKYIA